MPSKRVAVVVPASSRTELSAEERVSLRHLDHYLGRYDSFLVVPSGSPLAWPGLERVEFSPRYFGSLRAHNRLMLSRQFYQRFADYEFILVHHLDAIALSDKLEQWCDAEYDYIGAPMFRDRVPSLADSRTGNGGFSLRRVSALLRVLDSRVPQVSVPDHWRQHYAGSLRGRLGGALRTGLKLLPAFNGVRWETRRYPTNEDIFWADRASHYAPLNLAPVSAALRFAFSREPRYCLEAAGGEIPFGVHGWYRRERELWEPFLLPDRDGLEIAVPGDRPREARSAPELVPSARRVDQGSPEPGEALGRSMRA